jgi:hypothetical protein
MITSKRKEWQKPELIIIVKNSPAESVLGTCKTQIEIGPRASQTTCLNAGGESSCQGHAKS